MGYREELETLATCKDADGLTLRVSDWMALLAKHNSRGFGTRIYKVMHPIALGMDAVLGTNMANCGGCAERMERWNARNSVQPKKD